MNNNHINRESILSELRLLKPEFEKNYGITRLGLFGSIARNEIHENSDIDIVVEMREPDLFYMVHIKEILENDFKRPVDVIHFRENMNKYLKTRIQAEALYV
jgi:predicted nucleotidyltransferase